MNQGYLIVDVFADNITQPLKGATVKVLDTNSTYETDINGKIEPITLFAPSIEGSIVYDSEIEPYSKYDIEVSFPGMTTKIVRGVEIFPNIISTQPVTLRPLDQTNEQIEEVIIPDIVLKGNYIPKYIESEDVVVPITLREVIIPEYIKVIDGSPDSYSAPIYTVPFVDYIKNVASGEIYSSWPYEALKANILAIISFTLNRVYTEWYPSKGYSFTITSVTAYDQKYTHDRTIFDSISNVVDEIFTNYISRIGKEEPMLAQYCDGETTQNDGWLWQWGSASLAEEGKTAIEILKYYYGDSIEIEEAKEVEGLPVSFPGFNLKFGDCGEEVRIMQNQLNTIRGNYPGIPLIENPNGVYDQQTAETISFFQKTFNLFQTGNVDYGTWYKIQYLYTAVKRMIFGVYDR